MISQKFGYYHVGIFLVDQRQEYAILRAANSSGGHKMIERGHVAIGSHQHRRIRGKPQLAAHRSRRGRRLRVLEESRPARYAFRACPALVLSGQVIGVLDVQSVEGGCVFPGGRGRASVLANQVSTALENARLFSETRASLDKGAGNLPRIGRPRLVDYYRWLTKPGYKYDGAASKPLDVALNSPDVGR